MAEHPLETIPAADAYAQARTNTLRRYPSPDRDGDRLYPLAAPSAKPSFRIGKTDKVFTIGSCFARNVEASLIDVGMTVTSNETDLGPVGESLGFAANFFNKYAIHSILNDLTWALERDTYPGDDVIYEMPQKGLYADLQLGMSKLDFPRADIRDFRNRYLDVMARVVDADVVIITLGYVETWYDRQLGIYLNTSPPQPLVKANPDRFEFRVLSSKSVQRAAIDAFIASAEGVDYFPSYEFVMLSNPEIAWARGDYRHVSPDLVARIMSNVITQYVDTDSAEMTTAALQASARMLYKMADYDGIKTLATQHSPQFETNTELLVMLGNAHLKTQEVDFAFAVFEAAYTLDPTKPAPLERLISLCRPTRQPKRAKTLLAEHAKRFPKRTSFRDNITV